MARDYDPYRLSSPQVFLWRMIIFLIIVGFIALVLYQQIITAFVSNPGLNGLILAVLIIGILLSLRQVLLLFREVQWVNGFRRSDPNIEYARPPILLAPMAAMLGDRLGAMAISQQTMRSVLESIGVRLDESREILRYLTGLLVFLGLLGTFWGLLRTVGSVGDTIQSLNVGSGDAGVIFEDLKTGLEAPLSGMGTAFSSSLFGLAGSLILGFLDLQAGQAQTRFYTDLEDWLSTVAELEDSIGEGEGTNSLVLDDLRLAIDKLSRSMAQNNSSGNAAQPTSVAMASLAEGIQGLVQHMRSEQQVVRSWVESQSEQQNQVKRLLEALVQRDRNTGGN
ncbi:flagellar motor protein MotA [Pararhizobium sp. IMCC21322]|uniref:flagellar motor protein MotA n=1 Tax=Pararhizobium sp. IMCC21322 TaxID=3067903 RepID=UPI0027415CD1|nr:flagellar motor protein MotA [Pararhizobium sp. IMCC21322]